jgi:hypothetical protein
MVGEYISSGDRNQNFGKVLTYDLIHTDEDYSYFPWKLTFQEKLSRGLEHLSSGSRLHWNLCEHILKGQILPLYSGDLLIQTAFLISVPTCPL